jgi:hypothetical protein
MLVTKSLIDPRCATSNFHQLDDLRQHFEYDGWSGSRQAASDDT